MADGGLKMQSNGDLVWYKPDEDGPVFRIAADGALTVHKMGTDLNDMAKLFWEAVHFQGMSYTQKLHQAEQMILALYNDPCRQVVMEGEYEVFKHLKDKKTGVPMNTVRTVLGAVKEICGKQEN